MRRVVALVAAMALAVSLSGASLAAGPATVGTIFVGSFDFLADGVVVGHIDAQISPWSAENPVSGWYRTSSPDGKAGSSAQIGVTSFNRGVGYNEVWFNAMELGAGGTYGIFTGHFRDYLDPATPDGIDFFGRRIDNMSEGAVNASLGNPYDFHFTVGKGAFVLVIH